MATKFGRIDSAESSFEEQPFNKGQVLTSSSLGIHHHMGIMDCKSEDPDSNYCSSDPAAILNTKGLHWAFVHNMFYMSGSTKVSQSYPADTEKFNSIFHNFNQYNDLKPFWTHKFYESASVFYIPQAYFGERIQPGSFVLTGRTGSFSNETKEIIIKDDNNGNLYSTNAEHSQSALTSLSSSENYIGNIFYDLGVAVLTETASWSGSVRYMDVGRTNDTTEKTYKYWNIALNSVTPIFTSQYSIKIPAGDFNNSMNATTKPYNGGDYIPSGSSIQDISNLRTELTTGSFAPYFNQIQLYRNKSEEPLLIANLPRSIQMRSDIDIILTFRLDH